MKIGEIVVIICCVLSAGLSFWRLIHNFLLGPKICHFTIVPHTHTQPSYQMASGFCLGQPGWAGTRRNIHPLLPIMVISHLLSASSIYYDPWHPPCSIYVPDSLFSTISLQVFFGLPLGLAPSTSYSIHFFIQSLSSFRSICPYHRNLFCSSTKIMSSNPSLSTLYLELYLIA